MIEPCTEGKTGMEILFSVLAQKAKLKKKIDFKILNFSVNFHYSTTKIVETNFKLQIRKPCRTDTDNVV